MFYLKLNLHDGTNKIVRVFVDEGTFSNPIVEKIKADSAQYYEFIKQFFIDRMSELMESQGRNDYIYAGTIIYGENGRMSISRFHQNDSGKTAQDNFNDSIYRMQLRVSTKEALIENTLNKKESIFKILMPQKRTYITSDIHGMYGSYVEALKILKEGDELYILGDVIDRGKYGIEILLDIMERKNVKFVMGNHEWQMIEVLDIIRKYGLVKEDFEDIYGERMTAILDSAEFTRVFKWIEINMGKATLLKYFELPTEAQDQLYKFLSNSAICRKIKVGRRQFCLVHAVPPKIKQMLKPVGDRNISYRYCSAAKELDREQIILMLEGRIRNDDIIGEEQEEANTNIIESFMRWKEAGFNTIFGHTPSENVVRYKDLGATCVDTGCSSKGKLSMMCLENGKIINIPPIENIPNVDVPLLE